jgi:hypothetical protein
MGCRGVFGVGGGVGSWRVGYMEVLDSGIGFIVTSTLGTEVERFERKKKKRAMTGTTVKIKMTTSPSRVNRR